MDSAMYLICQTLRTSGWHDQQYDKSPPRPPPSPIKHIEATERQHITSLAVNNQHRYTIWKQTLTEWWLVTRSYPAGSLPTWHELRAEPWWRFQAELLDLNRNQTREVGEWFSLVSQSPTSWMTSAVSSEGANRSPREKKALVGV